MKMRSTENPLYEFYNALLKEFTEFRNNEVVLSYCTPPNKLIQMVLYNNGCTINTMVYRTVELRSLEGYNIIFAYNASANQTNMFFDYIELYNSKILVIFMDYFKDFFAERVPFNDGTDGITNKSLYFDAILKLVETFIETTAPMAEINGVLSSTCAGSLYRFAPAFIAASILSEVVDFKEDDCPAGHKQLVEMLQDVKIKSMLCGVRVRT